MKKSTMLPFLCLTAAVGMMLRAAFFTTSVRYLPVSSDESITILQAKQIQNGKTPIFLMGQPYLFPAESYLNAPFAKLLPRTPFGARLISFLMGLLGLGCALAALRRVFHGRNIWPGAALILLPSSYLLIHQSAYALPGYPTLLVTFGLCLVPALWSIKHSWPALLSGFFAGLGCSTHMLTLPAALAAGYFCVLQGWRRTRAHRVCQMDRCRPAWIRLMNGADCLANFACFALGAALGLAPWIAATLLYPGVQGAILQSVDVRDVLQRVWSPIIRYTLPAAMGIVPVPFPDNAALHLRPMAETAFVWIWIVLVGSGIFLAIKNATMQ